MARRVCVCLRSWVRERFCNLPPYIFRGFLPSVSAVGSISPLQQVLSAGKACKRLQHENLQAPAASLKQKLSQSPSFCNSAHHSTDLSAHQVS